MTHPFAVAKISIDIMFLLPSFVALIYLVSVEPSEHLAVTVILPQEAAPVAKIPVELILVPVPVTLHDTVPLQSDAVYYALLLVVISSGLVMVIA